MRPPTRRALCPSNRGYHAHWRAGEEACAGCRAAHAAAERVRVTGSAAPRELRPCGTTAAYRRHLRRGEPACRPCSDANAAANYRGVAA